MVSSKIVENYADALLAKALEGNLVEKIEQQLVLLLDILQNSDKINGYLTSQIVSKTQKQKLIVSLAKHSNLTKLLVNFLQILIQNHRFSLLVAITDFYKKQVREQKNIKQVEISSAKTLTKQELEVIKTFLFAQLKQDIEISTKLDNSLLGGVVLKYDSNLIDCSIKGALSKVRKIANLAPMVKT